MQLMYGHSSSIIDDAQWLDTPTVEALGFIARRIDAEPIIMLIAVRAGHPTTLTGAHLPQVDLAPLDADSCSALLDRKQSGTRPPSPWPHPRRRGRQSAGIGRTARRPPLSGDGGQFAEHLPLTERLQNAFTARLADLPAATRLLLLVAAANDDDSLAEALLAASALVDVAVSTETFEPAVAAGLIRMDLTHMCDSGTHWCGPPSIRPRR